MRRAAVAAALAAVTLTSGAGTFALWTAAADAPGGTIHNGTIALSADTTETSMARCRVSALRPVTPDAVVSPGQQVQWRQDITGRLTGDNAAANLDIDWPTGPSLPDGWTGTVQVVNAQNHLVAGPVPVGERIIVPDVYVEPDGEVHYSLLLTADGSGAPDVFGSVQSIDLSGVRASLAQVRGAR